MGGKFFEAKYIIPLMPAHHTYCEVFGGSFVLLINKPRSPIEFGNDKFSCLVSFWRTIQKYSGTKKLIKLMKHTLNSRQQYQEYMRMNPEKLDVYDRAYRFLYLITFGFNSYMDTYYTPITHKLGCIKDHMSVWQNNAIRLMDIHYRIKNVIFTNYDFRECLQKQKPHKKRFIFLDPPYINTHQYDRGYNDDLKFPKEWYLDMRKELEIHNKGGTKWMITCNQTNHYFDDMDDVILKYINRRACINNNEKRKEVQTKVVMNYDVNEVGSCIQMLDDGIQGGILDV
jgi:DNA adenine methylase